jgi:hypothetical protein
MPEREEEGERGGEDVSLLLLSEDGMAAGMALRAEGEEERRQP